VAQKSLDTEGNVLNMKCEEALRHSACKSSNVLRRMHTLFDAGISFARECITLVRDSREVNMNGKGA